MTRTRLVQSRKESPTFGERLAAAFGSMLFSLPVIGVLWFLLNIQMAQLADSVFPVAYFVAAVALTAVLAFAFPHLAPDLVGRLWRFLYRLGKWF